MTMTTDRTTRANGVSARLAFWAKNMLAIRDGRMEWPGFSYSDPEWARMDELGQAVSDGAYVKFVLVNAVVFIAIAALAIGAVFIPLATILFPIPAETSALKFTLLLAGTCFLTIGLGLPLSMRIASALLADRRAIAALPPSEADTALAAKVAWQLNRITLIMCGLLVPGVLLFIAYDIDGGPIVAALKWAAIGLMGLSTAAGMVKQRRGG